MAYANRGDDNHASIGLRFRRMLVRSASFAAAIQVCLVLYMLVAWQNSLGSLFFAVGIAQDPHTRIGYFLIVALMVFALIARMSCNSLDAWSTESEVDSFHRRHNSTILLVLMCGGCMVSPDLVEKAGNVSPFYDDVLRSFVLVVLYLLGLAREIVFGPTLFISKDDAAVAREVTEDEFYRAIRAKACKAGFAMMLLAGSFALLLFHNNLGQESAIMFAVLYAGVAVSLLYYDYLIWRADRAH
jgi:hypothetical protein